MENVFIKKADGTKEPFQKEKLENSLKKSGAGEEEIEKVVSFIESELHEGMTTHEIYSCAFKKLKEIKEEIAIKYSLRDAVIELGPTGFPFEKFVSAVISQRGYETATNVLMKGACVEHEIDVLAKHKSHNFAVEAKFHNEHGTKTDLRISLYVKARFDDLWESPHLKKEEKPHAAWLVTNTKFTNKAIEFGNCAGMILIGWNYPEKGNLQDMIEESKLHPITSISSLSKSQKSKILKSGVVLCRELREQVDSFSDFGIPNAKKEEVLREISSIIGE